EVKQGDTMPPPAGFRMGPRAYARAVVERGRPAAGGGRFLDDVRALPGRVSVRLRLTLFYGLLFFMAGGLLLLITYVLVADILRGIQVSTVGLSTPEELEDVRRQFVEETMNQLIGRSLLALAGVGIMALVLGYFVADRALA